MAYDKDKVFKIILSEIEEGASLRSVLSKDGMPNRKTFFEWLDKDEIKCNQYARATDIRTEVKFESIERDYLEEPQRDPVSGKIDTGWVQLQRLKIDAKKWELSKLKPKKYGDKIQTEHSGEITTTVISLGNGIKPNETNI
jgi:hypothetical protein